MESGDYESGPYCPHWSDVGSCEQCAEQLLGVKRAMLEAFNAQRTAIVSARELAKHGKCEAAVEVLTRLGSILDSEG